MTDAPEGTRLSLRQVGPGDMWMLWEWRNQPRVRDVSFDDREIPRADHETWFTAHLPSLRDRTIIVEWDGVAVGWYQVSDWNAADRTGGWSYVLGQTSGTLGLGALLPLFGLAHGFERMTASALHGQVLDSNFGVKSLFDRFGIPVADKVSPPAPRANGSVVGVTNFEVLAHEWPGVLEQAARELPPRLSALLAEGRSAPIGEHQ